MIPLYDENPRTSIPIITLCLIAINVVVFLAQRVAGLQQWPWAMVPSLVTHSGPGLVASGNEMYRMNRAALDPAWLTIFSSMFMHGGLIHLGGNMLFLWVFGDNLEDALGKIRYLLFYLLGGVAAALFHILSAPTSQVPTVGASGAIAAVMGGYILLFPHARIRALVPLGLFVTVTSVPAYFVLGLWFLYQLLLGSLGQAGAGGGGVAYWAHVGGFVAGFLTVKLFGPRVRPRYTFEPRRYDGRWW